MTDEPRIGFVVGRYFAAKPDLLNPGKFVADYNGIHENIEAVIPWALELLNMGFLPFVPHLNTHHFEAKTCIDPDVHINEKWFQVFDRKLLEKAVNFIYAIPNWRKSSGGRLEIQLACHLQRPVFESVGDAVTWATGGGDYSTVHYNQVSPQAVGYGQEFEMPIVLVDGSYCRDSNGVIDMPAVRAYRAGAEAAAIELFNGKIGAITPVMNFSIEHAGVRAPEDRYDLYCREMIRRCSEGIVLSPGWKSDPAVRARIAYANELGIPVFDAAADAIAFLRNGERDVPQIVLAR